MTNHILVETALLGEGLPSIDDAVLRYLWPVSDEINLAWLYRGNIICGNLSAFLLCRQQEKNWRRADARGLAEAIQQKFNAFLTVSASLRVADLLHIPVLVTAGLGGKMEGHLSSDLQAVSRHSVLVIASAFKDVCDTEESLKDLSASKVRLAVKGQENLDGFLFQGSSYPLPSYQGQALSKIACANGAVLFNPLPEELRISNRALLQEAAIAARPYQGTRQFHPTINRELDRLSQGRSSELQLLGLIANLNLAIGMI